MDAQLAVFAEQHQESTYYLSRLLKKNTGKNFKELLKTRKMREAGRMLHTTTLSTDGIMERIGYSNSSFFTGPSGSSRECRRQYIGTASGNRNKMTLMLKYAHE